jgi:antitoxin component HigA of HigAB toxin-antitoxin module
MNLNQIAATYDTTVEQYINGEWITVTVEVEATEVTETAEVTEVEATEVTEFLSEMPSLVATKSGPSKIIASLRAFGLTVKDIANQVGVSTSTVYRWASVQNWPLDYNYNNLIMVAGRI